MRDPDLVQSIHEDYIRAGAEIVIANTFATSKVVLEAADLGHEFEANNRRAVEVVRAARAAAAEAPVWVAGSISPMLPFDDAESPNPRRGSEDEYRQQAEILADAGADLLLAEMMLDFAGAAPLVAGAASVDLPLWVGFSAGRDDEGQLIGFLNTTGYMGQPTEDLRGLIEAVLPLGGRVAGIMHSSVPDTGPALDLLSGMWSGPTMAYAETGSFKRPYWQFEEAADPETYADAVVGWINDHGVQIVGGCCGTGPEHIKALSDRLA